MMIMRNVSIGRFQAICLPMKAHASASSSRSYGICVAVCMVAFCLNIPVFCLWVSIIAKYSSFDGAPHRNTHIHTHICKVYTIYTNVFLLVTTQKAVR